MEQTIIHKDIEELHEEIVSLFKNYYSNVDKLSNKGKTDIYELYEHVLM